MSTNIKNIYGIEMNDCKISGDIVVTDGTRPKLSNPQKIGKKEEMSKEYAEAQYPYAEQFRFQCEVHFEAGWDACMKHLASLPWDEAIGEIVKHIETNCSEKTNSSKLAEV